MHTMLSGAAYLGFGLGFGQSRRGDSGRGPKEGLGIPVLTQMGRRHAGGGGAGGCDRGVKNTVLSLCTGLGVAGAGAGGGASTISGSCMVTGPWVLGSSGPSARLVRFASLF